MLLSSRDAERHSFIQFFIDEKHFDIYNISFRCTCNIPSCCIVFCVHFLSGKKNTNGRKKQLKAKPFSFSHYRQLQLAFVCFNGIPILQSLSHEMLELLCNAIFMFSRALPLSTCFLILSSISMYLLHSLHAKWLN